MAEARQRGLPPAEALLRVIEERAAEGAARRTYKTPQERIRAMDALTEACSDRPPVPDSAFDRADVYEDSL
jgi:hypothetical protein